MADRPPAAHTLPCVSQRTPDGGWGAYDGYALVPTLSATEALLTTLRRGEYGDESQAPVSRSELTTSIGGALRMLLAYTPSLSVSQIPDTPAIDLIATSLIDSVNRHLAALRESSAGDLRQLASGGPLRLPAGLDGKRLSTINSSLDSHRMLPTKVLHALEVVGQRAYRALGAEPSGTGAIGASPAATAAWIGGQPSVDPHHPARRFLEEVVEQHDGLAPCGIPITIFERAWVLSILARAFVTPAVPGDLVESLNAALGLAGAAAAAGLPTDADTTSGVLYSLARLGAPRSPAMLWLYETGTHFCTWPGEQGFSTTTNAHVLEAFGSYLDAVALGHAVLDSATYARCRTSITDVEAILCNHQESDGSWLDRWHASPYYATYCVAVALARYGLTEAAEAATARTVGYLLGSQRSDGSWGMWGGTAEETAYALQSLLLIRPQADSHWRTAVARGCAFLRRAGDGSDGPPMWHDKDLYLPRAIVHAAILGALHLVTREAGN